MNLTAPAQQQSALDRMVDREEVLDSLWGESTPGASESLDVIISRLRRKLGHGDGVPVLRTIRGTGFSLVVPR